jgi:hypothetical protein
LRITTPTGHSYRSTAPAPPGTPPAQHRAGQREKAPRARRGKATPSRPEPGGPVTTAPASTSPRMRPRREAGTGRTGVR